MADQASLMTIDFSKVLDHRQHMSGNIQDGLQKGEPPKTADGKLLTPKQIRARARRKAARSEIMTDQEMEYLYQKPIEDWDLDELAAGRTKNKHGTFSGRKPAWINTAVHEEAMTRYTAAVKSEMRGTTVDALDVIKMIINDDERDDKGKPIVPPSVKLEASKFLIEHVVGKPTQRIENDVSVKLQAILGTVMVNPSEVEGSNEQYFPGHFPGITMALGTSEDNVDDYDYDGSDSLGG